MWLVIQVLVLFAISSILATCASTQLNYNSLDLAASVDSLITRQLLFNLARTLDDQYSIPSQIKLAAGSANTTNSVTPNISYPLSNSVVATNQLVSAATRTITQSTATTNPSRSLTVAATDQWQQGWTLDPVTNPDDLRRLRSLYRYATGRIDQSDFICEYPIQLTKQTTHPVTLSCPSQATPKLVTPDPNFVRRPSCVLCSDGDPSGLTINDSLIYNWISNVPAEGTVSLALYGHPELYICTGKDAPCRQNGPKALHDFALFVFEATGQVTSSSGGNNKGETIRSLGAPLVVR
jgi:hypothetical protein